MTLPIFRSETVLVLAERPGDELRLHGKLIAGLCRAGRPPFLVVLTDGLVRDPGADQRVHAGMAEMGLPSGRLLMFGIGGELPPAGPVFDAAVRAVCFVSWRHDCNVLCMSGEAACAVRTLAQAAVAASGVGLVLHDAGQSRLLATPRRSAREDPA